ncbi:MAG: molybdopterin molybdotransferase MoeA [Thermomicrobiales bacterium]|nr:molybdopterin molybdotransferase MoeA [Thermomicrobiales bacterium]
MPEPDTPLTERPWENVERMVDVDHALDRILAVVAPLPAESVPLLQARGRIVAGAVLARDNVPPFRNSAMDGFAVRCQDVAGADWDRPAVLPVACEVAAGDAAGTVLAPGTAIRIMTGAVLPAGADAVVRFEETDEARQVRGSSTREVRIFRPPKLGDNVREAGEDIALGSEIARPGQQLTPARLGLLASVGVARAPVHRRPVVSILSTGNEVVPPGERLPSGKIRDSNAYVLAAMAEAWGAEVRLHGIARDTVDHLTAHLRDARDSDLIVTSGGVSLGDFDFVKDVLRAEGEVNIWQVRMKPGKPLAFGLLGETPLLGLPGNPVAAGVSFVLFGRPAILRLQGHRDLASPTVDAYAAEPIDNRGQRRHFMRVILERDADGAVRAWPAGEQGAGVLSSLAAANALLVVPESLEHVPAGTRLQAIRLDW